MSPESRKNRGGASGRRGVCFRLLEAAEAEGERRKDEEVEDRRGRQAAQDDEGHRTLDLAPRLLAADRDRQEAQRRDDRRHEDRHETLGGALERGLEPPGIPFDRDQML